MEERELELSPIAMQDFDSGSGWQGKGTRAGGME